MDRHLFSRWETPASDAQSLRLLSLMHADGDLVLIFESISGERTERLCFKFRAFFGYRNLLEEYRTKLWREHEQLKSLGWTRQSEGSVWLEELREHEPLFRLHGGDAAIHYMVCTQDDVVEVLAGIPPEITSEGRR